MYTRNTLIGIFFLLASLGVVFGVIFYNSSSRQIPVVFAPRTMLLSLWEGYKTAYLEPGTFRTLDRDRSNITTSEGESYTMLRAVWMDDKDVFDASWKWTKDNLKHDNDFLFAWLFGKDVTGKYKVLAGSGGENTASDADTDIALSLVLAYSRWKDPVYLNEARAVMDDIWKQEVVVIRGRPYMAANNIERESPSRIIVNPSYFSPYAYRTFAAVDSSHNWKGLIDTSYEVLLVSANSALDAKKSSGLPPDWIAIDRSSGAILPPSGTDLGTGYGYDAMRIPWRLALDYRFSQDSRAKEVLSRFSLLDSEWSRLGEIPAQHAHNGTVISPTESPAVYGGTLGYWIVTDPARAKEVYLSKLQILYNPDTEQWKKPLGYYEDNWVWFGMALYHNELPDLTSSLASSTKSAANGV